jgi:hypothetical protein
MQWSAACAVATAWPAARAAATARFSRQFLGPPRGRPPTPSWRRRWPPRRSPRRAQFPGRAPDAGLHWTWRTAGARAPRNPLPSAPGARDSRDRAGRRDGWRQIGVLSCQLHSCLRLCPYSPNIISPKMPRVATIGEVTADRHGRVAMNGTCPQVGSCHLTTRSVLELQRSQV